MVKHAKLPSGEILEFPDETSSAIMDRAVREHLGLPEPTDHEAVGTELGVAKLEVMAGIGAQIARAVQVLEASATEDKSAAVTEAVRVIGQAIEQNSSAMSEVLSVLRAQQSAIAEMIASQQRLAAAVSAPKTVKFDRDSSNRITNVNISSEPEYATPQYSGTVN